MNDFVNHLETEINDDNIAYTENDALAFASTKSALLDFFSNGGALRSRDEEDIINIFRLAYEENSIYALKALFYFRDIRGGQGERRTFRVILKWLAENHPDVVCGVLNLIPKYGRWDDLYALIKTPLEKDMFALIKNQLDDDVKSESPSLLAKWLKSENTSSKQSKYLAYKTRKALKMNSREYRKMLSALRYKIKIVERQMSKNDWGVIQYDKIPSKASLIYRKAFYRHDGDRYEEFLEQVAEGKTKINASTLYPYEIVERIWNYRDNDTLEMLWKNLPDYIGHEETNGIVVADVSASMCGRPMAVSISLALYMAERAKGPYAGKFITFSRRPYMQTIEGETLFERVNNLEMAQWDTNTDIKAVFDLVLCAAIKNNASQDELPSHLYIVSDMEFDAAVGNVNERLFQTIEREYKDAGYKMPMLVFWNVDSRNNQQSMSMDQRGFQLVSGCSPSIFKNLLANKMLNAYDFMMEVLNDERYSLIRNEKK